MTGPCLKPLSLPIILKTHDTHGSTLEGPKSSSPCLHHQFYHLPLSLTRNAPATIVLTFPTSHYALPCLGAFALAFLSAWSRFYPTHLLVTSSPSSLHLNVTCSKSPPVSTASVTANPLLSFLTIHPHRDHSSILL